MFKIEKNTEELLVNVYIDDEFAYSHLFKPLATVEDLKVLTYKKTNEFSVNYLMDYKDKEISRKDKTTLFEIFDKELKDEYNIYITRIQTLKKYENQQTLLLHQEGKEYILVYKLVTMKCSKAIPQMMTGISFYKDGYFPYNAAQCHLPGTNIIVITGGINHENQACYYDYDTNQLVALEKMKSKRQRHSMVGYDNQKAFIIGGDNCKDVCSINIEYEEYVDYPALHYDRKDCSVSLVDNRFLYVFMGYSYTAKTKGVNNTYERLDIAEDAGSVEWKLLPLRNPHDVKIPKTLCGVVFNKEDNYFVFFGGVYKGTATNNVLKFYENEKGFEKFRLLFLPQNMVFKESSFIQPNLLTYDYYIFTYGNDIVHFNSKNNVLEEIPMEWELKYKEK